MIGRTNSCARSTKLKKVRGYASTGAQRVRYTISDLPSGNHTVFLSCAAADGRHYLNGTSFTFNLSDGSVVWQDTTYTKTQGGSGDLTTVIGTCLCKNVHNGTVVTLIGELYGFPMTVTLVE